jgi:16S rRNA processing protein RimM
VTDGSRPAGDKVRIGRAGKAHGSNGRLYLETPDFPDVVHLGSVLWILGEERKVIATGGMPGRPLVRLEGVLDRPAAVALKDTPVWAVRDDLPALGDNEWYGSDLEGMVVTGDDETPLGHVVTLVRAPSVDVIEVRLDDGGELLVPVNDDALKSVDLERRRITVDRRFLGLEDDGAQ